jgi:hypothetical protein
VAALTPTFKKNMSSTVKQYLIIGAIAVVAIIVYNKFLAGKFGLPNA